MRLLMMATAIVCSGACSSTGPGSGDARPVTSTDGRRCIDGARVVSQQAAGPDSIRFRMQGGVDYVSRVPGCPGIAGIGGFNAVALEQRGTEICRGDFVRAFDPAAARAGGLGGFARCPLGGFTPVPPER